MFSAYNVEDISSCVRWMRPFVNTLYGADAETEAVRKFSPVPTDEQHTIQTHSVNIGLLVRIYTLLSSVLPSLHYTLLLFIFVIYLLLFVLSLVDEIKDLYTVSA